MLAFTLATLYFPLIAFFFNEVGICSSSLRKPSSRFVPLRSHLYIFNFGLGQQQLLVIVTLPLFALRLELQHSFLGLSQPLSEVCDLTKKNKVEAQPVK